MKKIKLMLLVILFLSIKNVDAQTTLDVKVYGGAVGDGVVDDRAAIQKTIDGVNAAGGGTVFFPSGTYKISKVADNSPIQVICLKLYSNIKLEGVNRDSSFIKLADNVGNFDSMVGSFPSFEKMDNVQIKNLCFDANGAQNPTNQDLLTNQGSRNIVRVFIGKNYLIENCRFTNHKGIWSVVFNGLTSDVVIRNNEFTNIGDKDPANDWDHSTIYTNGNNFLIENNLFSSISGPLTGGARTAMEIHGSNQIIRGNTVNGYAFGVNVTGFSENYNSFNQTYCNNVFNDMMDGFVIWSDKTLSGTIGLGNIRLFENEVNINASSWEKYVFFDGGNGFSFERNRRLDIENLYIFKNKIKFLGSPINDAFQSRYSNGITMGSNNIKGAISVRKTYILKNDIFNPNGPGIHIDSKLENSIINGNIIENAATTNADLFDPYRSAFYFGENTGDIQISFNKISKTNTTSLIKYNLFNNCAVASNPYFIDNNTTNLNIPTVTNGSNASGLNWITTPNKPLVQFSVSAIDVKSAEVKAVTISLDKPATSSFTVNLLPIDREDKFGSNWTANSQSVTFNAGEQSKTINITDILTPLDAAEKHYLIIEYSNNYLVDFNSILEINLLNKSGGALSNLSNFSQNNETSLQRMEVNVFPNPASTNVNLAYTLKTASNVDFELFDMANKQIKQFSNKAKTSGDQNFNMDVSDLKSGIYFIKITADNDQQTIKRILVNKK